MESRNVKTAADARALVEAQHRDRTFKDERLRNAYAGGELIDPHLGTTRLPGAYDPTSQTFVEDENAGRAGQELRRAAAGRDR